MKNKNKEETILYKESALIASDWTGLSLLQRKLYNALLFWARKQYFYKDKEYWEQNAETGADKGWNFRNYSSLRENQFKITIKDLSSLANQMEINEAHLVHEIEKLHKKHITLNLLSKDKTGHWDKSESMFYLIQYLKIGKNEVIYEIPYLIFDLISQNQDCDKNIPFAKIDMLIQRTFKSKFSAILYEIAQDYINAEQFPVIDVSKLKKIFGVGKKYKKFGNFRLRCLDPAIKEVNEKIKCYAITYELIRDGHAVKALKFIKTAANAPVIRAAGTVKDSEKKDDYITIFDFARAFVKKN